MFIRSDQSRVDEMEGTYIASLLFDSLDYYARFVLDCIFESNNMFVVDKTMIEVIHALYSGVSVHRPVFQRISFDIIILYNQCSRS